MANVVLFTAAPNSDGMMGGHQMFTGEKRPPNGLGYLLAVLRQAGHHCEIVDRYAGDMSWADDGFESFDLAGIYTCSVCTDDIRWLIDNIKCERIAVGGPHAALRPEWFAEVRRHSRKDVVVVKGEGEDAILALLDPCYLDHWKDIGPDIEPERIINLDSLPVFPWEYFWDEEFRHMYQWSYQHDKTLENVFTMNTTRGCPYGCEFCVVKELWGRKITGFSAGRVLDDIEYCRSLGAKAIYFREDNFTALKTRLRAICEGLKPDPLPWICETRADVDLGLLYHMKEAGCKWVYVGVESLSQRMLDIYNKRITVEQVSKFFAECHALGIKTYASMIVGHPEETERDREITFDRIGRLQPDAACFNTWREI
ncbi:MAG TPA: radical SAM protein [Anaerolineae bacterium]|nr:radical SAM protein [Anaerolineae bacterium]